MNKIFEKINSNKREKLKKFKCASFAFWEDDIKDVSFVINEFKINKKVVIFGLNPSKTIKNFKNFHVGRYDKWYKVVFSKPPYVNAYMTDVIERTEPEAKKIMVKWRNNSTFRKNNIKSIKTQLEIIGINKPLALAIGKDTESILKSEDLKFLFKDIKYIPHPNSFRTKGGFKKFAKLVSNINKSI
jgi:hypothetical protein